MRETGQWKRSLITTLRKEWPNDADLSASEFCSVELGLFFMETAMPGEPADALWVLLSGFPADVIGEHRQALGIARHLLPGFKSRHQWRNALGQYLRLPSWIRGYDICGEPQEHAISRRKVSVCPERFDVYDQTLREPPPFCKTKIKWAEEGVFLFKDAAKASHDVVIPAFLVFPPPPAHSLHGVAHRPPLAVSMSDLRATAHWMDEQEAHPSWVDRLSRVRLELFGEAGVLEQSDVLALDEIVHLVGMVSSGKSTLIDILATHLSRAGYHTTIVVNDVVSALNKADQFANFGLLAAPVLGASRRKAHIEQLHLTVADDQPGMPWQQHHRGFRWTSTACPLSALRQQKDAPLDLKEYPCKMLFVPPKAQQQDARKKGSGPGADEIPERFACPLYARCPYHQAQRDLVQASIWIVTPESLAYTRVADQINAETITFAELVYRRSDVMIVDEADQMQVRLDNIFSLSETLIGRGQTPWFNRLEQHVWERLHGKGYSQGQSLVVNRWVKALHTAGKAVMDLVYLFGNLVARSEPDAMQLRRLSNYFSDWMLYDELAEHMGEHREEQGEPRGQLRSTFSRFMLAPFTRSDEVGVSGLRALVQDMTFDDELDKDEIRRRISDWIREHAPASVAFDTQEWGKAVFLLEFALITTVLQNRLDALIRDWERVEEPLGLDSPDVSPFRRTPKDFVSVLPASPMGNVLAFQYLREEGDLRFLRCMGIGRWMLLHFHEMFAADGIAGPHVLLTSGTSWAGTSPSYHVQHPVAGILRAPDEEIAAIRESRFEFRPLGERPYRISGTHPNDRPQKIGAMMRELASPQVALAHRGLSWLEQQRLALPEGRQNFLLVVGSYNEAEGVSEAIKRVRRDWQDSVVAMIRDGDEEGDEGLRIRRGRVGKFQDTGAWMLAAPLLAIERGHNILNLDNKAALGGALFLVRPHPRPDDLSHAIHSINRWAIERFKNRAWRENYPSVAHVGENFRGAAVKQWFRLLETPVIYSSLPSADRVAIAWNSLVTVLQVVGRLIRGGCPAQVFFCDAAFMPHLAYCDPEADDVQSSLLIGFTELLRPYFDEESDIEQRDRDLVHALYGPFYTALARMME